METNKDNPDYSWIKVHWKNFREECKILIFGIIKNFKRVSWHSRKGLVIEYFQVIGMIAFLSLFCFLIYLLVNNLQ